MKHETAHSQTIRQTFFSGVCFNGAVDVFQFDLSTCTGVITLAT